LSKVKKNLWVEEAVLPILNRFGDKTAEVELPG
jgi:hypothetical protein